jgi:hypothetical protein
MRADFTLAQDLDSDQGSLFPALSDPSLEKLTGQPIQRVYNLSHAKGCPRVFSVTLI